MENIIVRFFHGPLPGLEEYKDKAEFPFSKETRNDIIDDIMEAGYNVLLQRTRPQSQEYETLIIWIDKYRFQQR